MGTGVGGLPRSHELSRIITEMTKRLLTKDVLHRKQTAKYIKFSTCKHSGVRLFLSFSPTFFLSLYLHNVLV